MQVSGRWHIIDIILGATKGKTLCTSIDFQVVGGRDGLSKLAKKWTCDLPFSVLFSSVTQSCPTLCNPMDCSTPGFPVHHQLPQLAQTHVGDVIQPSHSLVIPFPSCLQSFSASRSFQWLSFTHIYILFLNILFHYGFSSVTQSCPTLCNPMDCSPPGLPVHRQLPEFTQTHVHWVSDAIQPSHPLSSPSPPALNLSQHQGLFKWVSSSHQVAKLLELQLQRQSFQWTPRTDLL